MEFTVFVCHICGEATTYHTLDALGNHRLDCHERPMPPWRPRVAEESGIVGRARPGPWQAESWHRWVQRGLAE